MAVYNYRGGATPYVMQTCPYYNGSEISKDNPAPTLSPRYTDQSTARTAYFDSSDDYSPPGSYVDFSLPHSGNQHFYSYVGGVPYSEAPGNQSHRIRENEYAVANAPMSDSGSGGSRHCVSIWMQAQIGTAPHPGVGTARTYFSVLCDAQGSHQGGSFWNAPGNVISYTSPRVFLGMSKMHVTGQRYGLANYRDWMCLSQYYPSSQPMNATTIRVINWGYGSSTKSDFQIIGFKLIHHIYPSVNDDYYGLRS